jgi:fatty-acyl-CoA synthase
MASECLGSASSAAAASAISEADSVLARATQFWDDCVKYGATQFEYIGELCRYLLNSPPHKLERKHKLRVVMGNGLRPEIWSAFKARFKIPKIIEFYGATEGNVALVKYLERTRHCGHRLEI